MSNPTNSIELDFFLASFPLAMLYFSTNARNRRSYIWLRIFWEEGRKKKREERRRRGKKEEEGRKNKIMPFHNSNLIDSKI
jgi:hypothetical protein